MILDTFENGKPIKAYSKQGLEQVLSSLGQPMFRVKQLYDWLYAKHATSYEEMTNLPAKLRDQLKEVAPVYESKIIERRVSRDGTRKYIVEFNDGNTTEMVAMPSDDRLTLKEVAPVYESKIIERRVSRDGTRKYIVEFNDGNTTEMVAMPSDDRLTVCFSTQIGCPMECSFCATGKEGFTRNLLPGEMVDQIVLAEKDMGMRVSNVVAMGQGEPFLNYDNVLAALRILNDPAAVGIGARHITVSTCGLVDGIRKWMKEPEQFTLAVSLHSAIQKTRNELMPRVANQSLEKLQNALVDYTVETNRRAEQFTLAVSLHSAIQKTRNELMPRVANQSLEKLQNALVDYTVETNRRATLEYIMIDGVNDDDAHLDALRDFCEGMLCHVNLIPINSVEGSPLQPPTSKTMQRFVIVMQKAHLDALRDFCEGMLCHVNLIPINSVEGSPLQPPTSKTMQRFVIVMQKAGIETTVRNSRGQDIDGACGQLKNKTSL